MVNQSRRFKLQKQHKRACTLYRKKKGKKQKQTKFAAASGKYVQTKII